MEQILRQRLLNEHSERLFAVIVRTVLHIQTAAGVERMCVLLDPVLVAAGHGVDTVASS